MNVFTVKVNPLIGKKEWVANPEHYDYYQEVARSSYADMLHDKERNEKYHIAIKKAVQSLKEKNRPVKVLDIGTGTGLLSMMAAHLGVDCITACEVFQPVAKCAEEVIKANGFEGKIKIIQKHSTELTVGPDGDMKEKANLLLAEVFDTELIGEGALKTFKHAINHLLEDDPIVIPSAASIYVQIIDSPLISSWNKLLPIKMDSNKIINSPQNVATCPGSAAVHDIQMSQLPKDKFCAVTEPVCVFKFDFTGNKSIEMNETFIRQVTAITNGNCEVIFMWWDLKMDMAGDVILNNGPAWVQPDPTQAQWRDHWMQAVYYLPEAIKVSEGDRMTLIAYHDEYSLWFAIPKANNKKAESPTCSCLVHVSDSHARIGMKNDQQRNSQYIEMLKKVIQPSSVCLCISDGSLLPLMAAKLGAKKVYTVESSHFHQSMIKSYIEANEETNVIKVIEKDPEDLKKEDLEEVSVLIAEPYFTNCVRPWEMMCFRHLSNILRPLLAADAIVVPQCGVLRAVGVHFDDLWKIRAPVVSAEGFDLSKFDQMVQHAISIADCAVEPHPLWEYPSKPVTEVFDLLRFDFSTDGFKTAIDITGEQPISSDNVCNGIALWTDYSFHDIEVTTGPTEPVDPESYIKWYMNTQQGVYFLHPAVEVKKDSHFLRYNISLNLNTAETTFSFTIV